MCFDSFPSLFCFFCESGRINNSNDLIKCLSYKNSKSLTITTHKILQKILLQIKNRKTKDMLKNKAMNPQAKL